MKKHKIKAILSENHLVLTNRGLIEAQKINTFDTVIGVKGFSKITNIIKCDNRPGVPTIIKLN